MKWIQAILFISLLQTMVSITLTCNSIEQCKESFESYIEQIQDVICFKKGKIQHPGIMPGFASIYTEENNSIQIQYINKEKASNIDTEIRITKLEKANIFLFMSKIYLVHIVHHFIYKN